MTAENSRDAVEATLRAALDAFNRGDQKAFRATWADDVVGIINETPPHFWSGPDAVEQWLGDTATDPVVGAVPSGERPTVVLKEILKITVNGPVAFAVLIVSGSAGPADKRIQQEGMQISVLALENGQWRVRALAFGSGLPV